MIRTETNYFNSQSEQIAAEDDGLDRYEFNATLDGKTTRVCLEHAGQIYYWKDAVVGKNLPPMLPNCRSNPTTLPNRAKTFSFAAKQKQRAKELLNVAPDLGMIGRPEDKDIIQASKSL